jgi:hypothetical protein
MGVLSAKSENNCSVQESSQMSVEEEYEGQE